MRLINEWLTDGMVIVTTDRYVKDVLFSLARYQESTGGSSHFACFAVLRESVWRAQRGIRAVGF